MRFLRVIAIAAILGGMVNTAEAQNAFLKCEGIRTANGMVEQKLRERTILASFRSMMINEAPVVIAWPRINRLRAAAFGIRPRNLVRGTSLSVSLTGTPGADNSFPSELKVKISSQQHSYVILEGGKKRAVSRTIRQELELNTESLPARAEFRFTPILNVRGNTIEYTCSIAVE